MKMYLKIVDDLGNLISEREIEGELEGNKVYGEIKKVQKLSENKYEVLSSKGDKWYSVNMETNNCDCPAWKFKGCNCKHLDMVRASSSAPASAVNECLKHIKENPSLDSSEVITLFGDELINELLRKGEIYEESGKFKVLE